MSDLLLEQAFAAKNLGEDAAAEKLYLKCLDSDPENAEALRELGLMQYGLHKNSLKAQQLIEHSLTVEDCPQGRFYLALVLADLGFGKEAEHQFKNALERSDGDALVDAMYADFLATNERLDEAEEHFKAALLKDPECEYARKNYPKLVAFRARERAMDKPTKEA
jgi:Tfp pilus assembly protein PilF